MALSKKKHQITLNVEMIITGNENMLIESNKGLVKYMKRNECHEADQRLKWLAGYNKVLP